VREITRSLQENLTLEIHVDSDIDKAVAVVKAYEGVSNINTAGDEIRCEYTGKRTGIADLNAHLIGQGVRVMALNEIEVDLENVFLTVTGHETEEAKAAAKQALKEGRQQTAASKDEIADDYDADNAKSGKKKKASKEKAE
jgi:hypothetical protein